LRDQHGWVKFGWDNTRLQAERGRRSRRLAGGHAGLLDA
jgi:hypothetical protein